MTTNPGCKVAACILVRLNSTRLPRKGLADIGGKPMVLRLVERLRLAETIDDIVICTSRRPEDRILLELAEQWRVQAIAGDEHDIVSRFLLAADRTGAQMILRIPGDNVFTDTETIDRMVPRHVAAGADYTRTNGLPLGMAAEVMSLRMLRRLYDVLPNVTHSEYLLMYAFDPTRFRCLVLDATLDRNRPNYSVTVDTQEDLDLVRKLFAMSSQPAGPSTSEVICMLDAMPGLGRLDGSAPIRMPDGQIMTYEDLLRLLDHRTTIARQALPVSVVGA